MHISLQHFRSWGFGGHNPHVAYYVGLQACEMKTLSKVATIFSEIESYYRPGVQNWPAKPQKVVLDLSKNKGKNINEKYRIQAY